MYNTVEAQKEGLDKNRFIKIKGLETEHILNKPADIVYF